PDWPIRARARETTPAGVLRVLGRVALWGVIALLLVRGVAAVMASEPPDRPVMRPAVVVRPAVVWPDDRARALLTDIEDGDGGATLGGDEGGERPNDQRANACSCAVVGFVGGG
ncbi:MAG: hypothetical protein ACM3UV_02465, partial [Nocardioidaceae bacterium]